MASIPVQRHSHRFVPGYVEIPSGYVKIAIEHGPFIDGLPIKNDDFYSYALW